MGNESMVPVAEQYLQALLARLNKLEDEVTYLAGQLEDARDSIDEIALRLVDVEEDRGV
jgi:uncharacterized membrane protein